MIKTQDDQSSSQTCKYYENKDHVINFTVYH